MYDDGYKNIVNTDVSEATRCPHARLRDGDIVFFITVLWYTHREDEAQARELCTRDGMCDVSDIADPPNFMLTGRMV